MELQDEHPQWKVLPEFAQLLLDHQDDLEDYQEEFRRLAYWVAYETFHPQTVNRHLAAYAARRREEEAAPLHVEEVAYFERDQLTAETLGLRLDEAKQMLAGVQQVMTGSQVEAYAEQQRQCPHCQQSLAYKGHHQINVCTLFGKLPISSPRLYTCSCQPQKTRSWSPVAALFTVSYVEFVGIDSKYGESTLCK